MLWQLDELARAVDAAEADKQRFQLSASEIASRRQWVTSQRETVDSMVRELSSADSSSSNGDQKPSSEYVPASSRDADGSNRRASPVEMENQRFVSTKREEQQRLVQQQDEELEELSQGVVRLGEVGRTIGEELNTQNQMLSGVEEQADTITGRLRAAERKMQQVMKKTGMCGQISIIVCLIVTLIVLIILVSL